MISEKKIGDVFKVTSGGTPSRKKQDYFKNGTIPWVKTGDLKGKYANKPKEYITELALANSSAKIFPKNTVLLAMYGATIGACSILKIAAATNQACGAILPSEKCDHVYLYYYLKSINKELISKGVGGAQPNISGGVIKSTKIPLPPLDQQKKIAAILDAADSYRQKTKALIEKYDELTQSLFLDMFGDPITNPKGWDKVALNELCDFKKTSVKPEEIETGDTYIGLECIEKQTGKILEIFIVEAGEIKSNKFWFDSNYILYGKLRPYLNKVANPDFEGVCSTDIIPIRPILKNTAKEFIISLLRGSWFVSFADERCSGANLPRISPTEVEKYQTINPPIKLQNQFAERVQAIEAQKAQAIASLAQAEDLFNSLLQRAFKGELTS